MLLVILLYIKHQLVQLNLIYSIRDNIICGGYYIESLNLCN